MFVKLIRLFFRINMDGFMLRKFILVMFLRFWDKLKLMVEFFFRNLFGFFFWVVIFKIKRNIRIIIIYFRIFFFLLVIWVIG